ncbi:MAG: PilZ domain-containing protein [Desulfatitalea sp.]|nr:PilZ domain-containing protein [Desulfatitalea sp.]
MLVAQGLLLVLHWYCIGIALVLQLIKLAFNLLFKAGCNLVFSVLFFVKFMLLDHVFERKPMNRSFVENRRKVARKVFGDNVYVVIDTQPEILGQLIEISATGMAFSFVDLGAASQRLGGREHLKIDLYAAGKGHYIRFLTARVVSNTVTCTDEFIPALPIRRIGVEFLQPTIAQQVQINLLSRRHTHAASSNSH